MTKYDLYWKTNPDWYNYTDDEEPVPYLTEAAPPEARGALEDLVVRRRLEISGIYTVII